MGTVNAGAPFAFSFWPEFEFALLRDAQKWVLDLKLWPSGRQQCQAAQMSR